MPAGAAPPLTAGSQTLTHSRAAWKARENTRGWGAGGSPSVCSAVSDSFATPWTRARQAPLSVGFSRKNTGGGCHSSSRGSSHPRDRTCVSCPLHWQQDSLPQVPLGKPQSLFFYLTMSGSSLHHGESPIVEHGRGGAWAPGPAGFNS